MCLSLSLVFSLTLERDNLVFWKISPKRRDYDDDDDDDDDYDDNNNGV